MTMELIAQIFEVCIIPLLGVLTAYLVKFINAKSAELASSRQSELEKKYITMLNDTITDCVIATTQTYVDSLKKLGQFDQNAQVKAFNKTKDAVMGMLNDELKDFIVDTFGDLNEYLNTQIEATVSCTKEKANS